MAEDFESKPIKEEDKTPNWQFQRIFRKIINGLTIYHCSKLSSSICHLHFQQYEFGQNNQSRKERPDKEIL